MKRPNLLPCAVQTRFDIDTLRMLESIETHARALGRKGFTRSSVIRDAVQAYVGPLVALLDRKGELDWAAHDRRTERLGSDPGFGETTRVRLAPDLVAQLDRVEAYARGLGYRQVTRSSLIRDGVRIYLAGFRSELMRDDVG